MFRKYFYDCCNLLTLLVASIFMLAVCNADVLYMAQSRSLCMSEFSVFMQQVQHSPDGFLAWVGCWLTQLFYYPWLGTLVLFALWAVTYWVLAHAFSIPRQWRWLILIPLISLLVSEIDLGYWIYYLKHPGYWFRESLGLLIVGLLLCIKPATASSCKCKFNCVPLLKWGVPILAALTYPLIGWYALLALLAMAIRSFISREWAIGTVALLLALIVPPALIHNYTSLPANEAWTVGFPFIVSNQNSSWWLTMPFIVMALSVVALAACKRWPELGQKAVWIQAAAVGVFLNFSFFSNFDDENFHNEVHMYRDMEDFRWDRLIDRFDILSNGPTRQMVMCKNLALLNLHHLGDGLFAYPNIGPDPNVNEGLEMHIAQTAAPMFYLQHGLTNDAIHWSIENSVEYGLTMNDIRIMALAAIIGGESRLATKYFNMLKHTLFGFKWAQRYFPLTQHPEWISEYPELKVIKQLHDSDIDYIVDDDGECEFRIYRHFANTLYNPDPLFQEVCLAYSLMLKNVEISQIQLNTYMAMHHNQSLPQYYGEAFDLFRKMQQRTLTRNEVDGMVESIHGKTYQWFFFKVNDAKTY